MRGETKTIQTTLRTEINRIFLDSNLRVESIFLLRFLSVDEWIYEMGN